MLLNKLHEALDILVYLNNVSPSPEIDELNSIVSNASYLTKEISILLKEILIKDYDKAQLQKILIEIGG